MQHAMGGAVLVHCRTGSLENNVTPVETPNIVHCRTGSLGILPRFRIRGTKRSNKKLTGMT